MTEERYEELISKSRNELYKLLQAELDQNMFKHGMIPCK